VRPILSTCLLFPIVASAATITVTRIDDPVPDGCIAQDCSLREAVLLANALSGADTIILPAGNYQLARAGNDDSGQLGDLDSSGPLEVDGAGPIQSIIVSTVATRILQTSADLVLRHLSVQGGSATGSLVDGSGGGIYVGGKLTLQDVGFSGNHADENGGAVYQTFDFPSDSNVSDVLRIDGSSFDGNSSGSDGGAVYQTGTLRSSNHPDAIYVSNSTFNDNDAGGGGGAIYSVPNASETQPVGARLGSSAFTGNSAQDQGGAVVLAGKNPQSTYTVVDAIVENCTFTGNQGRDRGGALGFGSKLVVDSGIVHGQVIQSTFEDNTVLAIGSGDAVGGALSYPERVEQSTIKGNQANANPGSGAGGAIAAGNVTVVDSLLQGNSASTRGGAITALTVQLRRALIASNSSSNASIDGKGGAIYLAPFQFSPEVRIVDSTLSSNASNSGGGLYVLADSNWPEVVRIENSLLVSNTATISAGAIRTDHALDIVNATFDANSAPGTAGILLFLTSATIRSSTLVGDGDGTGNVLFQSGSTSPAVTLLNSIVRGTCSFSGGPPPLNAGWVLESPGNTCGLTGMNNFPNTSEAALALGTLDNNGGPTPTRVPGVGSAAIDTGTSAFGFCPDFDQRGFVRAPVAPCDLGAVEVGALDDVLFKDSFDF
jgi:predicted outer membrane repeat protein